MSQNFDELLDLSEDLDYEIGDDEEEALLDDSKDVVDVTNSTKEDTTNEEDDILDLDTTGLNDEDSTLEKEEANRQDRFTIERPVQKCDEPLAKKCFVDQRQKNQSFRGRRTGVSKPIQNRQQLNGKRVLINPHFKGNLPIKANVPLVWDTNFVKKPAVHIQPWAHQTAPVFQRQPVYQNSYQSQTPIPQQKVSGTIFTQPFINFQHTIPNQQFQTQLYPPQAYAQPQQYPNYAIVNHYQQQQQQQQPLQIFNTPPPPIVNQAVSYGNSPMFTRPVVPPAQAPFHSAEVPIRLRKMTMETRRNTNMVNMGPQARRKFYQQGTRNRSVVASNLQEVRTSDVVIEQNPTVTIKVEKDVLEDDEQMQEYRRLIDQQKEIRESILARKEARRRQMAARETVSNNEPLSDQEVVPPPTQLVRTIKLTPKDKEEPKTVTKTIVNDIAASSEEAIDKKAISSFLSNRTIFAKEDTLPDTSVVVVSNLATGSTEVRLRKLCKGVGDVMNLQMSPKERQATIQFKSVASAHAFFKKYQRSMLDLSVIDVTLKK